VHLGFAALFQRPLSFSEWPIFALDPGTSQANLRCLTEASRDFHIVLKNKATMQIHVQSIT